MWILKSVLLGLWLFGFGTVIFLYFVIYRNLPPKSAVSVNLITGLTIQNRIWWAAFAVCLATAFAVVRSWSAPAFLWIAVLVTGLLPAGCLALFIVLAVRLKHVHQ